MAPPLILLMGDLEMLKPRTINQYITMLSGNKQVYEFVKSFPELDIIGRCKLEEDDAVELKNDKVLVTITTTSMTAMNVYGTIFEDLTRKDCKLLVLKEKKEKKNDKKTKRN